MLRTWSLECMGMLVSRDVQAKILVLTGLQGRRLQKQWKQLWNLLEFSWKKCREEETIVLTTIVLTNGSHSQKQLHRKGSCNRCCGLKLKIAAYKRLWRWWLCRQSPHAARTWAKRNWKLRSLEHSGWESKVPLLGPEGTGLPPWHISKFWKKAAIPQYHLLRGKAVCTVGFSLQYANE